MDEFLHRMKNDLEDEYELFENALQQERRQALRINTLYCDKERFLELSPWSLKKTPDCEEGYFLSQRGLWHHPYHHAGVFYLQDPSSMLPTIVLDPKPGEKVLDLCASPGGKTTQIAAKMKNKGILFSNEVVKSRIPSLLSSIERMGVRNSVVTNEKPDWYEKHFEKWFDRVLIDAPCSGEGMFRKSEQAIKDWSPEHVKSCAVRQKNILSSASACVRPGGILVYSTCTFSREENESVIESFLKENSEFELMPISLSMGKPSKIIPQLWRVYPHHGGEGQCMALLKRKGETEFYKKEKPLSGKKVELFVSLWDEIFESSPPSLWMNGSEGYILPEGLPKLPKGNIIRCGVYAGSLQKNRFVPSHHLFRSYIQTKPENTISLTLQDLDAIQNYLHGHELIFPNKSGYQSVRLDGFPLGFGKGANGKIKNHYPKGLREMI